MHHQDIIETLKKRRILLQTNQETLSLLSGISLRTVKQFESGKGNPTLLTLVRLQVRLDNQYFGQEIELCLPLQICGSEHEVVLRFQEFAQFFQAIRAFRYRDQRLDYQLVLNEPVQDAGQSNTPQQSV